MFERSLVFVKVEIENSVAVRLRAWRSGGARTGGERMKCKGPREDLFISSIRGDTGLGERTLAKRGGRSSCPFRLNGRASLLGADERTVAGFHNSPRREGKEAGVGLTSRKAALQPTKRRKMFNRAVTNHNANAPTHTQRAGTTQGTAHTGCWCLGTSESGVTA